METLRIIPHEAPGGVMIVRLEGYVDTSNIGTFDERLYEYLKKGKYRLILDCSKLQYINSTGLGILLEAHQLSTKYQGDVKLVQLPKKIEKVFDILGFSEIFRRFENEEEALKSFGPSSATN